MKSKFHARRPGLQAVPSPDASPNQGLVMDGSSANKKLRIDNFKIARENEAAGAADATREANGAVVAC